MAPAKKGTSSVKDAAGKGTVKRTSPLPKRKSRKDRDIKPTKTRGPCWILRSHLLCGNLEYVDITVGTKDGNAYIQQLIDAINDADEEETGGIYDLGFLGAFIRCKSLQNGSALSNARNSFYRKSFIRVLEEDETSVEVS